jgi:AbrB family looped-hinge helix DNA binding protein
MTRVTIDKLGRLVLPKQVRQELGVAPGDTLELHATDAGVELRPHRSRKSNLVKVGRVLVFSPDAPPTDIDPVRFIGDQRNLRLRTTSGR